MRQRQGLENDAKAARMRIVWWGTYDLSKPRNRILLRGLRENGVEVVECHAEVWSGIEDKSAISGVAAWLPLVFRWLMAYPWLILRYLRAPRHDAVFVGYLGLIDVLVIWPFARLRGAPIAWDVFLPLYDTVVSDRKMVGARHPAAWLLFALEWLACRAARWVILDTEAHAAYMAKTYRIATERMAALPVGVEPEHFPLRSWTGTSKTRDRAIEVLFYGQFIPLHGIDTIVRAARLARDEPIEWVLIGGGQEEARIRRLLAEAPLPRLEWLPWVDYTELKDWIHRSDICLGIFGDSDKAARVIPNKVFQVLSAGVPLVTRDSPAIREILHDDTPGVRLVPPADPEALLAAIRDLAREAAGNRWSEPLYADLRQRIAPRAVGDSLRRLLEGGSAGVRRTARAAI